MKTVMASCVFAINVFFSQSTNTTLNVDTTYDMGNGVLLKGYVAAQAVQSDGKIIVIGSFNLCGGTYRSSIARINTDGTVDTTFNPGTGFSTLPTISAIKIQNINNEDKIIISGKDSVNMLTYNGVTKSRLIRLNADGSLDTTFNVGSGPNIPPTSIDVLSDGSIVLAGNNFSLYNGNSVNNVCKISSNGTIDTNFAVSPFGGSQSQAATVNCVKVQTVNGVDKVLVGGVFAAYNGSVRNNILRLNLDGTLDTNFNAGSSVQGSISKIEVTSAGNLLLLGGIANYNAAVTQGLISLTSTGILDTSFNSGGVGFTNSGTYTPPTSMTLKSDGKILVSGDFTEYNGATINRIALLKADGTLDTNFNLGTGINSAVSTSAISSDGGLLFGGNFSSYNGNNVIGYFKTNAAGTLDASFNANATVMSAFAPSYAIKQADDKLIIAGNFNLVNGTPKNYLVRLNTDGTIDTNFNNGGTGPNNTVSVIALQADNKILIGGNFTTYNGISSSRIARLETNGTLDTTFTPGSGFTTTGPSVNINAIQQLSTQKILVGGGNFSSYNGTTITNKNLIQLNVDGTYDSGFNTNGTGVNNGSKYVYIIKEQANGRILVGGSFASFNGTNANGIIRLNADGTVDTDFIQSWGSGAGLSANAYLKQILIQPSDQKIIIGGSFSTYNTTSRTNIARLNSDGSLDTTFDAGTVPAATTFFQPLLLSDGKILVPGTFTSFNNTTINKLVRLNTNGTVDTSFTPGVSGAAGVFSPNPSTPSGLSYVFQQTDGNLLVVGNFSSYNGTARNLVARLTPVVTNNMATSNVSAPKFTIYPNPAKDFVNLSNITRGADVSVYDMTGKLLYTTKAIGAAVTINTSSYKNGVYMVKVDGQVTKLLISK